MPGVIRDQTVYIKNGEPDSMNESELYKLGELGKRFEMPDQKVYQIVKLDSGCTASASTGVVAANDLAFWKDKDDYIVTNDAAQALGANTVSSTNSCFRNNVAGIFRAAVTAGYYCCVLQRAKDVAVNASTVTNYIGDTIVAATGTGANVSGVAAGTAITVKGLGQLSRNASAATTVYADLDIPDVP